MRYAEDARQIIGNVIARVRTLTWKGRAGRTDHDVMLFVCRRATTIASTAIHMSAREATLGSGVGTKTASVSLNRLCRAGWLVKTSKREYHLAQEYRVTHPPVI